MHDLLQEQIYGVREMEAKRSGIVLLLAVMLLVSVVIVPVAGAKKIEKQKDRLSATPWYDKGDELNRLTTDELQQIAKKK